MLLASVGTTGAVLTACGNDPDEVDLTPTMIPDVSGAPPTLAPYATPGGGATEPEDEGGDTGAAGATEAAVSTVDLAFEPKELTIAAGTDVTITITNNGALQHDFTVDELGVQSDMLNGGDSGTVTINAEAGTYEFYCSVPGHKEAGMVGTLTVVEGGAAEEAPAEDGAAAGATEAAVDAVDIAFEPNELTIAAGTDVVITVSNKGALQHDFTVDDLGVQSDMLNGGDTATVTINAEPGTYEFYCSVPGHKEAGMVGTLTVVEGGAAPAEGEASPAEEEASPAEEGAAAAGATEAEMSTVDLAFEPKELTIAAGTDVTITITNNGALQHDMAIDDLGLQSDLLNGGDSTTLVVNAEPGEYEFHCSVPGHKEAGMTGTLIVQ